MFKQIILAVAACLLTSNSWASTVQNLNIYGISCRSKDGRSSDNDRITVSDYFSSLANSQEIRGAFDLNIYAGNGTLTSTKRIEFSGKLNAEVLESFNSKFYNFEYSDAAMRIVWSFIDPDFSFSRSVKETSGSGQIIFSSGQKINLWCNLQH